MRKTSFKLLSASLAVAMTMSSMPYNVLAASPEQTFAQAVQHAQTTEADGFETAAPFTFDYTGLTDGTYNITARAYDNDGNQTQSSVSKLHINSTAGTGEWTSTDIGNPGVAGNASLENGVMTVKGAGKLGASEGCVSGSTYADATTDDFQYTYQLV